MMTLSMISPSNVASVARRFASSVSTVGGNAGILRRMRAKFALSVAKLLGIRIICPSCRQPAFRVSTRFEKMMNENRWLGWYSEYVDYDHGRGIIHSVRLGSMIPTRTTRRKDS